MALIAPSAHALQLFLNLCDSYASCHGIVYVVLNVFIDIQTSKELIQMDTDKMMTYGTFTMDDEKLTQSYLNTT